MNKKLQVFVSSTYTDLIEERQAAVQAILDAGHIPAGMELFKAGKSQMKTIQKWIDESDVYMLILGGRYGSIEEESGLSYTELEYRYALSKNMPVFTIILEESFLFEKSAKKRTIDFFEKKNKKKYITFLKLVKSNIVKFVENKYQISSIIHSHLNSILSEYSNLSGWIRMDSIPIRNNADKYSSNLSASYNSLLYNYNTLYQEHHYSLKENIEYFHTPNGNKQLELLLKYQKTVMYKNQFEKFKLHENFFFLKGGIYYTLEDIFITVYLLSYCNTPINKFVLDDNNRDTFLHCMNIFFKDELFTPCNILSVPTILHIEEKGHEIYKYICHSTY